MKTILLSIIPALTLLDISMAHETKPAPTASTNAAPTKLSAEELEARFKATLTKATLTGRWRLIQEGKLGPEKRR